MPRHAGLPRAETKILSKTYILRLLKQIDNDELMRQRVLNMETEFRQRVTTHVSSLPPVSSMLRKFNTNPFVLLFYAKQREYSYVSQIENDILPAKLFSSMETSAGRMIQSVVLPTYGWEDVLSSMHSSSSVIDGRKINTDKIMLSTIKSGPRCLNDEMSKDIADDILYHSEIWANEANTDHIEFTYAVLYGTQKLSNKKDWHILRNIAEAINPRYMTLPPNNIWECSFRTRNIRVDVNIRIGLDWWTYLNGPTTLFEVLISLIRACIRPADLDLVNRRYTIVDLDSILSLDILPRDYNVSLLQRSQIEWLFFLLSHYCDSLSNE